MVPLYVFVTKMTAPAYITTEKQFQSVVDPHLIYLRSFPVAYGRSECIVKYYAPSDDIEKGNAEFWTMKIVSSVSIGQKKIQQMTLLYEALFHLLTHELPDFAIEADSSRFDFSS